MLNEYLLSGEVLKPQGLDGLVKVRVDMDTPDMILPVKTLYSKRDDQYVPLKVLSAQVREGFAFLQFDGIQNRDAAESLRGNLLYMRREEAPPLPEGRYYICDIVGCQMVTRNQKVLGTITDVMQPGANDVYVAKTDRGEMLVPVLRHVVLEIDVNNRTVVVDEQALEEVAVFGD